MSGHLWHLRENTGIQGSISKWTNHRIIYWSKVLGRNWKLKSPEVGKILWFSLSLPPSLHLSLYPRKYLNFCNSLLLLGLQWIYESFKGWRTLLHTRKWPCAWPGWQDPWEQVCHVQGCLVSKRHTMQHLLWVQRVGEATSLQTSPCTLLYMRDNS